MLPSAKCDMVKVVGASYLSVMRRLASGHACWFRAPASAECAWCDGGGLSHLLASLCGYLLAACGLCGTGKVFEGPHHSRMPVMLSYIRYQL